MLDIRLIRENPDLVKQRLAGRNGGSELATQIDAVLACDSDRRKVETQLQELNAQRKSLSKEIGMKKRVGEPSDEIEATVKSFGAQITALNAKTTELGEQQQTLLLNIPNLPHADAPVGADESANPELRVWGEKPTFQFTPTDHMAIGERLGLLDPDRGAKISGSGFMLYTLVRTAIKKSVRHS